MLLDHRDPAGFHSFFLVECGVLLFLVFIFRSAHFDLDFLAFAILIDIKVIPFILFSH